MYKITGQQMSFRLTDEEREQLNEFAAKWQTDEKTVFSNGKQLVLALFSHSKRLENKCEGLQLDCDKWKTDFEELESRQKETTESLQTTEHELKVLREEFENIPETPGHSEAKQQLIDAMEYQEPPTDEQLYSDVLEIITTPLEPAPTVEVVKEVERELLPTEVLLQLNAKEKEVLELIARYRFSTKEDAVRKTTAELVHAMVFNKGTLLNEHERFKTFLNNKKLRT